MKSPLLDQIVHAVLYEGYILYPYRPSSKKNQRERFTFGRVYPKIYSELEKGAEPCVNQTECLARVPADRTTLEVTVRFLHPIWREAGMMKGEKNTFEPVPELIRDGVIHQSWQEAVEREVTVNVSLNGPSPAGHRCMWFSFPAMQELASIDTPSGDAPLALRRRQEALEGMIQVEAAPLDKGIFRITVQISNMTPISATKCGDQDAVLMRTFASTHTILYLTGGEFVSLLDPPAELKQAASLCNNLGTWPVLVGDEARSERHTMLSSPIILYDYPKVAPESAGAFFDATEIDEMLTLRVLTMTDREKFEMRNVDPFARQILERTEAMSKNGFLKMHGVMRDCKEAEAFFNPTTPPPSIRVGGRPLRPGSTVRIHPKNRADAFDMMLEGKIAYVEAIEHDAEGKAHVAVVVEDDPGRDLGLARHPGHRFFYSTDEIEVLEEARR